MDLDNVQAAFATNVIGPAHVAQAYLPLVEKSAAKTIVNVSSTLGSLGTDFGPHFASYSISKAALNMLVRARFNSERMLFGADSEVRCVDCEAGV